MKENKPCTSCIKKDKEILTMKRMTMFRGSWELTYLKQDALRIKC